MNVIIFGPPGSGKGTQSNNIVKEFDLIQVSTGDLLRKEIKFQTKLGKKIELPINRGELVSNEIVDTLIEKIISDSKNFNKLIFDGYPRTLSQVYNLEKLLKKFKQNISVVFYLKVDKSVISKRINGRIICTKCHKIFNLYFHSTELKSHNCGKIYLKKRSDDNSKTILSRFEIYITETKPMLNYYKTKLSFFEIDANQQIEEIYSKIRSILNNIKD